MCLIFFHLLYQVALIGALCGGMLEFVLPCAIYISMKGGAVPALKEVHIKHIKKKISFIFLDCEFWKRRLVLDENQTHRSLHNSVAHRRVGCCASDQWHLPVD